MIVKLLRLMLLGRIAVFDHYFQEQTLQVRYHLHHAVKGFKRTKKIAL